MPTIRGWGPAGRGGYAGGGGLSFPGMGGGGGGTVPVFGNGPQGSVVPPGGSGGPLNQTAQTYPELEALQGRYNQHLDNLSGNTGHVMDTMATKFRDAREGGRENLRQANVAAGRSSTPATGNYESQTQRGVQSTLADVANERERMLTGALQGGLGIARAPAELALQEKGHGLAMYTAQTNAANQAAQMNLQALLAMLQAQRQSPIYGGGY
jgi:hypothetical protein